MQRRDFLHCASGLLIAAGAGASFGAAALTPALPVKPVDWQGRLRDLEKHSGGRLGVAALDLLTGDRLQWRGDERFRMCSTFKFLLAAAVLHQAELGKLRMDRKIAITAADMLSHAPFTQPLVGRGATVAQLCEATMTLSDNPAANLLLPLIGGPQGLTAFLRGIGDPVTRLDRNEPSLNSGADDDPRDTSSPMAQLKTMRVLLFGRALNEASREQLSAWLVANKTGDKRLRAGLPAGMRVGDKTGTANHDNNDLGVIWPPTRKPILIVSYLNKSKLDSDASNAVHASVARIVSDAFYLHPA